MRKDMEYGSILFTLYCIPVCSLLRVLCQEKKVENIQCLCMFVFYLVFYADFHLFHFFSK